MCRGPEIERSLEYPRNCPETRGLQCGEQGQERQGVRWEKEAVSWPGGILLFLIRSLFFTLQVSWKGIGWFLNTLTNKVGYKREFLFRVSQYLHISFVFWAKLILCPFPPHSLPFVSVYIFFLLCWEGE